MDKRASVPNRQYTDEFKREAVRLAVSVGGSQAAQRLGTSDSNLWNWIRLRRAGKLSTGELGTGPVKRSGTELEAENRRLRRERANAKLDLDIVKKAATYFARQSR